MVFQVAVHRQRDPDLLAEVAREVYVLLLVLERKLRAEGVGNHVWALALPKNGRGGGDGGVDVAGKTANRRLNFGGSNVAPPPGSRTPPEAQTSRLKKERSRLNGS